MSYSDSKSGSLLFHYHEKVYRDEDDNLWMSSSQGIWLDAIAQHFNKLYVLNFQAYEKTRKHDYYLKSDHVELISLGENIGYRDFFKKRKRIDELCSKWSKEVDYLLIRGFTHFQIRIWRHFVPRLSKSYILVRSLKQPRSLEVKKLRSWAEYFANRYQEFRFKEIVVSADNLFTNSLEIQQELLMRLGRKAVFSTTNILKASDFESFNFKSWSEEFDLLYVGRISVLKGCIELAKSFCDVQLKHPNLRMKLHLVGEGQENIINEINRIVDKNGLSNQIRFYGRMSFGEDLFSLYKKANAFVLASYTEGFPRVIWEAALFSTPIIVSDVGGIPFILENELNALLVRPKSHKAITTALCQLLENKNQTKYRARNAYELARLYTLDSGIKSLVSEIKGSR